MKKFIAIVFVWSLILSGGGVAYYYLVGDGSVPPQPGGGGPPKALKIKLALDSFSGYCIFRSDEFKRKLADQQIDLEWIDDEANYAKRMETVQKGETPLAVFTIDALITNNPRTGTPPATIVMVIDETRGADAMVGYTTGLANVDALNQPDVKVVLTLDSPSEMLLRVVRSRFSLPNFPSDKKAYAVAADGAEKVYTALTQAGATERKAFILWEPYVSMALKDPRVHVLVDSSRFKGFIVDVLVVQQDFLQKHKEKVKAFVQAYLEVLHARQQSPKGMVGLVKSDLQVLKEERYQDKAEEIARGIWWKNTLENYGHFGLLPAEESKGLQPLNEMIQNITRVLRETKQPDDPMPGVARPDKLVDADVLRQLYSLRPKGLHVGQQTIRQEQTTDSLTEDQWRKARPVASLKLEPIVFAGSDVQLPQGGDWESTLAQVTEILKLWPQYYLRVEGNTRGQNTEGNRELAQRRANFIADHLKGQGVPAQRIKAQGMTPGKGKEVGFTVLQYP